MVQWNPGLCLKANLVEVKSHFYWIQWNSAIPKAWKENLYKRDKNFCDLTFSGKSNSKELHSLQVSLNDTKTKPQIYFRRLFPNKEIEWKCIYVVWLLRRVTIDTNLLIFRYKILNNVLNLNEKLFKFKIVSSTLCYFLIQKMKALYTLLTLAAKQNLFGLNCKSYWTQRYFFHKIHHTHTPEGLKKNVIKIYNFEEQICFNDLKKETNFLKNGTY